MMTMVCCFAQFVQRTCHPVSRVWQVHAKLRVAVCKDRESAVSDPFGESLIFCPKLALGRLFSKIIFKSSNDFVYL